MLRKLPQFCVFSLNSVCHEKQQKLFAQKLLYFGVKNDDNDVAKWVTDLFIKFYVEKYS